MKNILSYYDGGIFLGTEIIDWANTFYQEKNKRGKYARYILKHYNLIPNNKYRVYPHFRGTGTLEIKRLPLIVRENYGRVIY